MPTCLIIFIGLISQVWSSRDFKPVKVLSGHEAKVTSVDVAGGNIDILDLLLLEFTLF